MDKKENKPALSGVERLIPELRFPEFRNEEEWEKKKLSVISDVIMGSSPSSTSYNENKIGLPLLQGNADIKNRLSSPRIYTTEITKECEVGDILLSVRAPVGTVAKSLHNACIGRGISTIRAKTPNSQEYLYQWLFSYESSWQNISQGGTFDAVNSDDIRNLQVPLPKPQEQQKIASCLSSLDEVILAHSQKLELLKDHKKGLMQNLFPQEGKKVPKLRFKEFEKDGEWVEKKLGEVAEIITGSTPNTKEIENYDGKRLFVSPADINGNRFISQTKTTLTELGFSKTRHIKENSILFVCIGSTIGKIAQNKIECATNQQINSLIPYEEYSNNFLYSSLENSASQISELAGIQAVPIINKSQFSAIKSLFPKLKEQQKIASVLSFLDDLITAQTEKIEQLKEHKKGLMQGLFPKMIEHR